MADLAHRIDARTAAPGYAEDYAAWIEHQRQLMREHRLSELDLENLIDEVGDLGSNIWDKYVSAIELVLLHMLKWDYQSTHRSRSWQQSIGVHRDRLIDVLAQNPSFTPRREDAVTRAYRYARREASGETNLPLKTFPENCLYDWTAITTREHVLPGDDA